MVALRFRRIKCYRTKTLLDTVLIRVLFMFFFYQKMQIENEYNNQYCLFVE